MKTITTIAALTALITLVACNDTPAPVEPTDPVVVEEPTVTAEPTDAVVVEGPTDPAVVDETTTVDLQPPA